MPTTHALPSTDPILGHETATSRPKFDNYKLKTDFEDNYIYIRPVTRRSRNGSKKKRSAAGFGNVWLQKEKGGQLRAVKVLLRDSLPKAGFSQELLALIRLKSYRHLFVNFYGWYENKDHVFLAMEYMEYGDLHKYMLNNPQQAKSGAQDITSQILKGLEVLHREGICHRDLKPQNILIASFDPICIKIADFGVAKEIKNTTARTAWGSNGYCAPEILGLLPSATRKIKVRKLGYALDIWSLGSLVHEILTSQTPFASTNLESDSETGMAAGNITDMGTLVSYCYGNLDFPVEALQESQVDEVGIAFVKSLLVSNPSDRPTASTLLQSPWLKDRGGASGAIVSKDLLLLETISKIRDAALVIQNIRSMDYSTRAKLFQLAARQPDVVDILIHQGIGVGVRIDNQSVLQWASTAGHTDIVALLLNSITSISTSSDLQTSFRSAIKSGHIDMVKLFIDANKTIINSRVSSDGCYTVLEVAVESDNTSIFKLLLDNGAHVNHRVEHIKGSTLEMAIVAGHIDIVKLLLENNAEVNPIGGGETVLQVACENGDIDIVKLLLDNKAEVNAGGEGHREGQTALHAASESGHIDIVRLLLDNKAEVNAKLVQSVLVPTALQLASENGHIDIVKLLLDNKGKVNGIASYRGPTALQGASENGHIDIVKLLLDNEAEVNAKPSVHKEGRTALQLASENGHIDIVKLLLDHKAEVNSNISTKYYRTALQGASENGYIDIVKLLLDNKACVNHWLDAGPTALELASKNGDIDIVKLLLDNKADVISRRIGYDVGTALKAACGGGHIDIVKLLCINRAKIKTSLPTALEIATTKEYTDIVEVLEMVVYL